MSLDKVVDMPVVFNDRDHGPDSADSLVCLHAEGLDQQLLRFLCRQPQLLPIHFEGHGSQCSLCSYTGAGLWGDS